MSETTPRPWLVIDAKDVSGEAWIEPVPMGYDQEYIHKGDAELIVTAVNAHDALMAVYEAAKAAIAIRDGYPHTLMNEIATVNDLANTLAAADAVIGETN